MLAAGYAAEVRFRPAQNQPGLARSQPQVVVGKAKKAVG